MASWLECKKKNLHWNTARRKHCCVASAIEGNVVPHVVFLNQHLHPYLSTSPDPAADRLIVFAWVMSKIDTKYNLIRSREQRRRDGRYWNGTGMAINGTTPSQCSIIAIWFINYPWRWGFFISLVMQIGRRDTLAHAHTHEGRQHLISWGSLSFLCVTHCRFIWISTLKKIWLAV